jgi:hypothetical protein
MTPQLTANDSASEHPVAAIISHALTILVALGAVGVPLLVPRFAAIFRDMLGDHPLPLATRLVLRFYPLLILLACSFAFAAIYFAWRFRTRPLPRPVFCGPTRRHYAPGNVHDLFSIPAAN